MGLQAMMGLLERCMNLVKRCLVAIKPRSTGFEDVGTSRSPRYVRTLMFNGVTDVEDGVPVLIHKQL